MILPVFLDASAFVRPALNGKGFRAYDDDGSHYVGMKAPAAVTTSYDVAWPAAAPGVKTTLRMNTDGSIVAEEPAGGSGANTALSNLASVAVNTTLISDTDGTDSIGNDTYGWLDGKFRRYVQMRDVGYGGAVGFRATSTDPNATPGLRAYWESGGNPETRLIIGMYGSANTAKSELVSDYYPLFITGKDTGPWLNAGINFVNLSYSTTQMFTLNNDGTLGIGGVFGFRRNISGALLQQWVPNVQTTDATVTTLWSETLATNTVHVIEVLVTARRSNAAGRWTGKRRVTVYREAGGAALESTVETIGTDVANGITPTVTLDASSNDVRLRVTGEAGKTIQWRAVVLKVESA